MKATVAERGQVTIPKALRDRLGVKPGTILQFSEEQRTVNRREEHNRKLDREGLRLSRQEIRHRCLHG
jgi:AbrB family looped-hinge helix DNA binding protein